MPSPWLDAGDVGAITALQQRMQRLGVQLVVLDNLTTVKGSAEENSAAMGKVMGNFRQLAEATGAAVMLIHHQRKDVHSGKGQGPTTRAGDRLRGHSSIEAAVDLALLVERPPHADRITLQGTKVRGVGVPPFGAQLAYEHRSGTTELAMARFFALEVEDDSSDRAIEKAVLEAVEAAPGMTQKDLVKAIKQRLRRLGVNRIRAMLEQLARRGTLSQTEGDRGAKRYHLGRKPGGDTLA
jgi:AAA domain